jgi:hypothetical protein
MGGTAFTLRKEELTILFNGLAGLNRTENLGISAPLLGDTRLFYAHLQGQQVRITDFCDSASYEANYSRVVEQLTSESQREIPLYDHMRGALYQAGIRTYEGMDRLEEVLRSLRDQDVVRGGDVYYVALDTNMLRDRFFSVYLSRIPPHPNLDFVLCETVREELKNRHEKLTRVDFVDPYFKNPLVPMGCFINQNALHDRMRYIGFLEYNRMRSKTSCEELNGESWRSGMMNDQAILKAYSDFVDIGRKVVFISRDQEAVRMMTGEENVIPVLLKQHPKAPSEFQTTWAQFFDMIYLLSVLFGRLTLRAGPEDVASVAGVWRQKDVSQWEGDVIRLILSHPTGEDTGRHEAYRQLRETLTHHLSALGQLAQRGLFQDGRC